MTVLHVCTAFDRSFKIPVSVMMRSVVENSQYRIHFHLLIPKSEGGKGGKFIDDFLIPSDCDFSVYWIDNEEFTKELRMTGIRHFSDAAIYRLFMPDYLPKSIDRVLYLDGDLYVNLDIFDIYKKYSDGIFSARIENLTCGYFNSGVFFTSLNYWRDYNVTKQLVDFLRQNPDLEYKDQDSLNYVFKSKNLQLENIYNSPFGNFRYFRNRNFTSCIFHFTGTIKPWKSHAPRVFPVKLWRDSYSDIYNSKVSLQKVKWSFFKKSVIWLRLLTRY